MITDEAVEAAARTLFELSPVSRGSKAWDEMADSGRYKMSFRYDARAVLDAASPFLRDRKGAE